MSDVMRDGHYHTGDIVAETANNDKQLRTVTAQGGQILVFFLTMLLAGMVLSNLVEEKSNKIIEILAASIPMESVFLGKLFAMLGMALLGIAVWTSVGLIPIVALGQNMPSFPTPAVGWPIFVTLCFTYFIMAYLMLGALFLWLVYQTPVRPIENMTLDQLRQAVAMRGAEAPAFARGVAAGFEVGEPLHENPVAEQVCELGDRATVGDRIAERLGESLADEHREVRVRCLGLRVAVAVHRDDVGESIAIDVACREQRAVGDRGCVSRDERAVADAIASSAKSFGASVRTSAMMK